MKLSIDLVKETNKLKILVDSIENLFLSQPFNRLCFVCPLSSARHSRCLLPLFLFFAEIIIMQMLYHVESR